MRARESSRNCLDCIDGVYRIPPDWPGPANFQPPLNYGRIHRSSGRISPCHHVHSPGGAPTKTCFDFAFHRTNPAELGQSPRTPRLRSEVKRWSETTLTCARRHQNRTPPSERLHRGRGHPDRPEIRNATAVSMPGHLGLGRSVGISESKPHRGRGSPASQLG